MSDREYRDFFTCIRRVTAISALLGIVMSGNVSNFPYSSGLRTAVASAGPAVLQTSREGGGEETGRLRRQMEHLHEPACVLTESSFSKICCARDSRYTSALVVSGNATTVYENSRNVVAS